MAPTCVVARILGWAWGQPSYEDCLWRSGIAHRVKDRLMQHIVRVKDVLVHIEPSPPE
jgi:hypothetical protein